jgi:zinc protease
MAFTGPFDYGNQAERTGIRAMAMILETRLRDLVREELGKTYSISVSANISWMPREAYTMLISFGSDPESIEETVLTILENIEDFKKTGPTADEVSDTREALLRSFETSFQRNQSHLAQLVSDYRRGVVPGESLRTYPSSVKELTPESIRTAAGEYLNIENRIRVTLLPEAAAE